jgi:hypothetical protein
VSVQIGEAAARRHTAPIASIMLWAALCGSAVIALHALSTPLGARLGSYRTGIATLGMFMLTWLYSFRKYGMWFSVRLMRLAGRLPRPLAVRILLLDRLETWRTFHVTLGVFAMLPFWWHMQHGRASLLELALATLVILLVLSGFVGAMIEDFLPARSVKLGDKEVRLEDVEAVFHSLYVEAEELVLGHSEALVHAYLLYVRPLLTANQPAFRMLWAILTSRDMAAAACRPARILASAFGTDGPAFNELVNLAEEKVRLEHNQFHLRLNQSWLRFHRWVALTVAGLIVFHIAGVLYFAGL